MKISLLRLSVSFSILIFFTFFQIGCKTRERASLRTFVDPSISSNAVKKVVVFPLRNTAMNPGEALEVNRNITQTFQKKNPDVKVIGSVEGIKMLNDAGLVGEYAEFLNNFEGTGIANTTILREIGEKLHVDAILQGSLNSVKQTDREGKSRATTILTVRYTLLSVHNGNTLWEGASEGKVWRKKATEAPPLYEVITVALRKILTDLPALAR